MTSQQQQPQQLVRFLPFRSIAEPSFWLDHNAHKLNELRLSEEGVPLWGFFGVSNASSNAAASAVTPLPPAGMRFDTSSSNSNDILNSSDAAATAVRRNEWIRSSGNIYSLNTIDSLKKLNKNKFLNAACLPSLLACCGIHKHKGGESSSNNADPNIALISSTCLTYCDLKSNTTVYWFAFPALTPRSGCGIAYSSASASESTPQRRIGEVWGDQMCSSLSRSFHRFRVVQEEVNTSGCQGQVWCPPFFLLLPAYTEGGNTRKTKCLPLNKSTYDALTEEEKQSVIFGFVDPNTSPSNNSDADAVGWTLRNLVAYLSLSLGLGGHDKTFLSYRSPFLRRITVSDSLDNEDPMQESYEDVGEDYDDGDAGIGQSLLLDIKIPLASDYQWPSTKDQPSSSDSSTEADIICSSYRCVGWELNKNNKPGPRSIDLRPLVSPAHLSRQANDLNLRLMKWRALPSLDVERLSQMKVLLLGAGTLGCGVARILLGWGIRKITFVDSGRVSYSNPVRQSLFGLEDCKDGGKYKAVAAAESLVAIAGPDVQSEGVVLTIHMPGHSFGGGKDGASEVEAARKDITRLDKLIGDSDVVFLLTDTRESRWLPTVMALARETPLINAALGLDSWLVMRHGPPSSSLSSIADSSSNKQRLGCYFCSDVVAPENSTRDRTLDQQCTVTRPGLASIAAGMATELMVAMFHHSLGHCAPAPEAKRVGSNSGAYAPVDNGTSASSSALGLLPHQIRGTVATYTMMTPTVPAFSSCTACSDLVVEEYRKEGFEFVKSVCCDKDGSHLEKVSGLASFREEANKKLEECFDWDDDEE